jgi:hypothetical protein
LHAGGVKIARGVQLRIIEGKMGNFKFARARTLKIARARLPNSRGAEHAVRAKHVDEIKTSKSRAGISKKGMFAARGHKFAGRE